MLMKIDSFNHVPEVVTPVDAATLEARAADPAPREYGSQGVYTPDPDFSRLAFAWPGRQGEREAVITYCVTPMGKTEEIRVARSSGVGAIDRVCRDAVKKWRFKPHEINGRRVRSCEGVSFQIRVTRARRRRR